MRPALAALLLLLAAPLPAAAIFRDCPACPALVRVPAGEFVMGAAQGDSAAPANERPAHRVRIPQPLAVSRHEITFAQWDACVADGGCRGYRPPGYGWGRGRQPVMLVSWRDARAYTAWLRRRTGRPYRLLSEAEWAYLARKGDSRQPAGLAESRRPRPVGEAPVNALGIAGLMTGVAEWVADCWHPDYTAAPADGTPRRAKAGPCKERVVRGASWATAPDAGRVTNRARHSPKTRATYMGFRVVRAVDGDSDR